MKQKLLNSLRLRACMLVALLCAGFTSAWGTEVTYDFSTGGTFNSGDNPTASWSKIRPFPTMGSAATECFSRQECALPLSQ